MQNATAALQELRRHRQRTDARETPRNVSRALLNTAVGSAPSGAFLLPRLLASVFTPLATSRVREHLYEPDTDPSSASPGEASVGATP